MNIGFKQAMQNAGLDPPNAILADGVCIVSILPGTGQALKRLVHTA